MYISIQTVCTCHGYLLFESIHCDRCRSLIPFQLNDESLTDPTSTNNVHIKATHGNKHASDMLVPYRKQRITTGRIRFRALCPFCNSPTYVLRYYCKRERLYYHLRIQNFAETEQSIYKAIADTQNMHSLEQYHLKHSRQNSSINDDIGDSYSLIGSIAQRPLNGLYDQNGIPNARDIQIESEKQLHMLHGLEGDLFNVLRNGLFFDTIIQCQDDVKLQVHRCILGGRSPWFRHLLSEYHDSNLQDDYILQISIDDVQSDVMNEVLNFMYTNRCLISLKNAPNLIVAAKRFEIEQLRKLIADFLLSRLTVDNAIEMLISAHEAGSESLKLACIRLINRNAEKIKRTEKWRTFKTHYVDLVPELYESRIEGLPPVSTTFLPDVFSAPEIPSESLRTLSRLYEKPVKQRFASPVARKSPVLEESQPSRSPTPVVRIHRPRQSNELNTLAKSASFTQQNVLPRPSIVDRLYPGKKEVPNKTRRQVAAPGTRPFHSTVRQNADFNNTRRPNNVYDKSTTQPTKHQTNDTQTPRKPPLTTRQKSPPPIQQKPLPLGPPKLPLLTTQKPPPPIEQHRSPPPVEPKAPRKTSRGVSPRYVIEVQQSPTSTDEPSDEQFVLAQYMDIEPMD